MGVLQIITPYIDDEIKKQRDLQEKISILSETLEKQKDPAFYVEGVTDKLILEAYFKIKKLRRQISIIASQTNGGAVFVHDRLIAWAYSGNHEVSIGLFDRDEAGKKYYQLVINNSKIQAVINKKKMVPVLLDPPGHISNIFKKNIVLPVAIEELFPPSAWKYAESKNWLESRDDLRNYINVDIPNDKSIKQLLEEIGLSDEEMRYVLFKVKDSSKSSFASYIVQNIEDPSFNGGLQKIYDKVNNYL